MAKNKNTAEEVLGTDAQTNGTGTEGEGQAAKAKKPKKERIFSTSLGLTEIRKREQKLSQTFNRLGRTVKEMGLSPENEKAVLDVLAKEYDKKAGEIFTPAQA